MNKGLLPCPACGGHLVPLVALVSKSGKRHGVRHECSQCPRAWDFYDDEIAKHKEPRPVARVFDAGAAFRNNPTNRR